MPGDACRRPRQAAGVQAVRHLPAQRRLAGLICAAALLLKLLVPTGCMIGIDHGRPAITICPGMAPAAAMAMDMPRIHGDAARSGHPEEGAAPKGHGRAEMPCALSGLSAAVTGAIDPVQLAALVAFVLAVGLACVALPAPVAPARLRPPLRGPPARR